MLGIYEHSQESGCNSKLSVLLLLAYYYYYFCFLTEGHGIEVLNYMFSKLNVNPVNNGRNTFLHSAWRPELIFSKL